MQLSSLSPSPVAPYTIIIIINNKATRTCHKDALSGIVPHKPPPFRVPCPMCVAAVECAVARDLHSRISIRATWRSVPQRDTLSCAQLQKPQARGTQEETHCQRAQNAEVTRLTLNYMAVAVPQRASLQNVDCVGLPKCISN